PAVRLGGTVPADACLDPPLMLDVPRPLVLDVPRPLVLDVFRPLVLDVLRLVVLDVFWPLVLDVLRLVVPDVFWPLVSSARCGSDPAGAPARGACPPLTGGACAPSLGGEAGPPSRCALAVALRAAVVPRRLVFLLFARGTRFSLPAARSPGRRRTAVTVC
ncbi:MAG TPA: hypothetical protein VIX15_07545, partial [Streptosporangiaceae bacterium]